ncbi:hypothetical protein LOAG_00866 [Loa loa]|uniref:MARVEL domain-containing protein n=1 Tax=Loa loa TaxID=7209 RepID=A0A1S0UCC3_LOALO|nr:hypothetical protein LOAG_00866 [Loa loa]EFO27615.1 hypothetical protein LOAG_00866 [Loa loa]
MSVVNILLAIFLLLFSIMQKGKGVHALADYFCFILFILIAIFAAFSVIKENLIWPLLGATLAILISLLIALAYHLLYCYSNRVDSESWLLIRLRTSDRKELEPTNLKQIITGTLSEIFEVAGSAIIYLAILIIAGFCTFIAIRWRIFVTLRRKVKKQRNASKEAKASLIQCEL